jgi:hypothetical protein
VEIVSSAVTNVRGDTIDLKMPGAVEINSQSESLLSQFFCTGKIRITETSIIIITVPIRENIAPHLMILSILITIVNPEISSLYFPWVYRNKTVSVTS